MTRAEKREIVLQLLEEDSARSNREIARIAGISHVAVGSIRKTYQPVETLEPAASLSEVTTQKVATRKLTRRTKVTAHPTPETYRSAESYRPASEVESYQSPDGKLVDLDHAPLKEIAARIIAWPRERRSELLLLLRRGRQRKLVNAGGTGRRHEWKFRTSDEQRLGIIAAAAGGMGTCAIAVRFGVKRQTVYSIIKKGR
jgi:hypothetical protein